MKASKFLRRSLKNRMIIAFAGFSVLLSLFYWVLLMGFLMMSEDAIFNRQLEIELEQQLAFYRQHQHFDQLPSYMAIFQGEAIQKHPHYAQLAELELGFSELSRLNLHVVKALLPSVSSDVAIHSVNRAADPETFYLIFSVDDQEIDRSSFNQFYKAALTVFVIVAVTGVLMGMLIGSRTASPLIRLDKRVQGLGRDESFGETESFGRDEIGRLAHSFAAAYDRSQQFLIREKRFTREVSHELRTPTAVIRGALDILKLQPENPKALGRIHRACNKIQQLIDTFLLLGREESLILSEEKIDAKLVCQMVIEQYQQEAQVPIHLDLTEDPTLKVLPPVFAVLLGNLLRNAVRHTPKGQITISLNKRRLIVKDTGSGFPPEMLSHIGKPYIDGCCGQGLGLSIVFRICHQFGWSMRIESEPGQGSQVHILFC